MTVNTKVKGISFLGTAPVDSIGVFVFSFDLSDLTFCR